MKELFKSDKYELGTYIIINHITNNYLIDLLIKVSIDQNVLFI